MVDKKGALEFPEFGPYEQRVNSFFLGGWRTEDLFGEQLGWKGQLLMKGIILSVSGIVCVLLKDKI